MASFYWYDYETFGTHPALDRPAQFAGLRTDTDLNPIGDPLLIYNRLSDDYLPDPAACAVTGISPDTVNQHGLQEREFIAQIVAELGVPGTCNVGYNSIRFDDEFTRFTLFRNFYDPYEHEWKNGNSRWDLLDVVRLTRALRPQGIEWPVHDDGKPSNRLEDLTRANGLDHESAHDALSDVLATISVARLIKEKQPRLFEYAYKSRSKQQILQELSPSNPTPLVHVSGMYPGEFGHLAIVAPVARHPTNSNGIVVFDLRYDPQELADLASSGTEGCDEIARRLFSRTEDLGPGVSRLPLKTVHANRSPVLVPMSTLDSQSAERLNIDREACLNHFDSLQNQPDMQNAIAQALQSTQFEPPTDTDAKLYSGGFFSQADRSRFQQIRESGGEALAELAGLFDDDRADDMLFRYRGRNFRQSLNADEELDWQEHCQEMLYRSDRGVARDMKQFLEQMEQVAWQKDLQETRASLLAHAALLRTKYPESE